MSATLVETAEEDSYVVVVQYVADLLNEGQVTPPWLSFVCWSPQQQHRQPRYDVEARSLLTEQRQRGQRCSTP
jgi:hypothetical protein